MRKKVFNIILSALFIAVISVPFFGYLLFPNKEKDNIENRRLTVLPKVEIKSLDYFPIKFEKHYNDHYGFRNELISLNNFLKVKRLGFSPMPHKVILGKDNWMYLVSESLEYYRNDNPLSSFDLQRFENKLEAQTKWCKDRGIQFYLLFAPNKPNVYPEYLPSRIQQHHDQSKLEQLMEYISTNPGIHVIDPNTEFKKLKSRYRLYEKTDSHWNAYGAYFATKQLLDNIDKDFDIINRHTINDFRADTVMVQGLDLARMLKMQKIIKENQYKLRPTFKEEVRRGKIRGYPPPDLFPYQYEEVFVTGNKSLPKVVIVRDSYTTQMVPFLVEHFEECLLIWDKWEYKIPKEILEIEKPDIFIIIISERKLMWFLNN